jgi:hypothetical protein
MVDGWSDIRKLYPGAPAPRACKHMAVQSLSGEVLTVRNANAVARNVPWSREAVARLFYGFCPACA